MTETSFCLKYNESGRHIVSGGCICPECRKSEDKYVRFFDINKFVDNLNDWD